MLEILPAGDPAKDHGFSDPPLVRAHGEVHVRDHEAHEPNTGGWANGREVLSPKRTQRTREHLNLKYSVASVVEAVRAAAHF